MSLHNVVIPTEHGMMIVNRHEAAFDFGVSRALMEHGIYEPEEMALIREIGKCLPQRPILVDVGANIGPHTLELARIARPLHGIVHAFEPQRILFQMLAGNVALNSHQNVFCHKLVLAAEAGSLAVPVIDYGSPASFGSLELGSGRQSEAIGQAISWDKVGEAVPKMPFDDLRLVRVDFMKIDVEGMEVEVLKGAARSLAQFRPILLVECIKSDQQKLKEQLAGLGYQVFGASRLNWLCIHPQNAIIQVAGSAERIV